MAGYEPVGFSTYVLYRGRNEALIVECEEDFEAILLTFKELFYTEGIPLNVISTVPTFPFPLSIIKYHLYHPPSIYGNKVAISFHNMNVAHLCNNCQVI